MFATFLNHQWKQFWRGRNKVIGIVAKILLGILVLYFILLAVALGLILEKIIRGAFPGENPVTVFNVFLLYYFLVDLIARLQLQEIPTLSVMPYLHLRVPRSRIVNFLNLKSLFSVFNLLPLLVFLPFCVTVIAHSYVAGVAFGYVITIVSLAIFNNFLVMHVKRKSSVNSWYMMGGIGLVAGLGLLTYLKVFSINKVALLIFGEIPRSPLFSSVFALLAVGAYLVNSRSLKRNLYLEELRKKAVKRGGTDIPFLARFGKEGDLAALEVKLIFRNKRPRTLFPISVIFLLYGFLMYQPKNLDKNQFLLALLVAIFITGGYIYSYGQLMFSWQSGHFDGLTSGRMDYRQFLKAKFLLFTIYSTLVTLVSLLYGFISWKIIPLEIAAYFYTIGFGTVVMLYFAMYHYKRIDIERGAYFNHEGSSAMQFLAVIPLFLIPFGIYGLFTLFNHPFWGIGAIGLFGLISLLMRNYWLDYLTQLFIKQRYKIAEGFRESV